MKLERYPITEYGYTKLLNELRILKEEERHAVIKEIAAARSLGDLSENAEYHAAREKQSFIESRIADLEAKLSKADVIKISNKESKVIQFGATVTVEDLGNNEKTTYIIVGDYEASIVDGLISILSPLSRALIGKSEGEDVEFQTPSGIKEYYIVNVAYLEPNFNNK